MSTEDIHELKETLEVEVNTPGHPPRTTSSLFKRSKKALFTLSTALSFHPPMGRCFICNKTQEELGEPLEAHHFQIEWSFGDGPIDWDLVKEDNPNFDWDSFDPNDPYKFVDNMTAQGVLLCKKHHTGKGTGIHNIPFGLWIMQRYLKAGYVFNEYEVIEHAD